MFFLSDTYNFARRKGSKDRKIRIRRRGNLLISNQVMPGYRPVQTSYIRSSANPNGLTRIQYQINDKGKQAFLGKPKKLNQQEINNYMQKGYLKGDYKANGEKY